MHNPYDQLGKDVFGRLLADCGTMRREHEVKGNVLRADMYFVPAKRMADARHARGIIGRMADTACIIEVFRTTPTVVSFDRCVRKQLTLDDLAAREAKKEKARRPRKPRLWIVSSGRPDAVLSGYAFASKQRWPTGVHEAAPAARWSVIVVSELPRNRDTLLLRLLGKTSTMEGAIADLKALPPNAWEREIAMEPLVALQLSLPEDVSNDEERKRIRKAMNELFEQWKQKTLEAGQAEGLAKGLAKGRAKGRGEGLHEALVASYEARFGDMPAALRKVLDATTDPKVLGSWVPVFTIRSAEEIATALTQAATPRKRRAPAALRRTSRAR